MSTVGAAKRGTDAEALLGEVETDARIASQAVELAPDDLRGVDATLHHQVFDQPAQVVDRQRGDGGGALAPALAHGARHVVLAAALPHLEAARIAHPAEARIETQHDLAERGAIPARLRGGLYLQNIVSHVQLLSPDGLDELHGVAHARLDAGIVGLGEQFPGDEVAADATRDDACAVPLAQGFLGGLDAAGGHDARPRHRTEHVLHELRPAHRATREHLYDFAAELVRVRDLAGRAAARRIGDAAAIANLGYIHVEDGTDDELGAV